ncbi:MAG: hypothetical protein ACRYG7_04655 [Janthinobacterium lividum]
MAVFDEGTFLTHRELAAGEISFFHLPGGFFVEVYYNPPTSQVLLLQSFPSTALLPDYTSSIELPEDWP